MTFITNSVEETEQLGFRLAQLLRANSIVALRGGLGAGKTAFTRGIGRGLGVTDRVASPTFAIMNEYRGGRLPLSHFDLYRISCPDELADIGFDDAISCGGATVVEWSENAGELPDGTIVAELSRLSDDAREINITIKGNNQREDISL